MLDLSLLNTIRAYKMGEINWEECKTAVDERLEALLQQTPRSTQLPPTLLSEDEFRKKMATSTLDKFRSPQFKKGMYAGYLETLDMLRRHLR